MATDWTCTYRLQLNASFTFRDAAALVDYLAELGVSHLYLSPIVQAAPGSTHGYDVVDPTHPSDDLDGAAGYEELCAACEHAGLGQMLDIVPNHMAVVSPENRWWTDVLEKGPESPYARYFDFVSCWRDDGAFAPVQLPVLEDHYEAMLAAGKIKLARDGGRFVMRHGSMTFPLSASSLETLAGVEATETVKDEPEPERSKRKGRDAALAPSVPASLLHALLEKQHYRLVYWKTTLQEVSYRRFFDVNGLVGVRVEDADVFDATHALTLELARQGKADGLRVDHIDGLRDPVAYLTRLQTEAPAARIVVEKVLCGDETLVPTWPVAGTTGYDFLNVCNQLFVDPAGEAPLTRLYASFTGETRDYEAVLIEKKRLAQEQLLGSELDDLTTLFVRVCAGYSDAQEWPRDDLKAAIRETIGALPMYRTYVQPERNEISDQDRELIQDSTRVAAERLPDVDSWLLDFLKDILSLRRRGDLETELVLRLQQLSGPAMAKGDEDTACYCYHRLVSLNEVGGDPGQFGETLQAFHDYNRRIADLWPGTMTATATHDMKRGEDVRLRIDALSEMPDTWQRAVEKWASLNADLHGEWPDRNTEYLLYQTLAGAWPISEQRLQDYMLKAVREAKVHTSWHEPNAGYEAAVSAFVTGILANDAFIESLKELVARIEPAARTSSLAQTLIKLTVPGIPDIYQGTELWDMSLVDPDNRRPVDYDLRRSLLAKARTLDAKQALAELDSDLTKLWLISRTLALRRKELDAFGPTGGYKPLLAKGAKADHVVAFARGGRVVTIAPRLVLRLDDDWADTTLPLPEGAWHNVLTNEATGAGNVRPADLLRDFPVALLVRTDAT